MVHSLRSPSVRIASPCLVRTLVVIATLAGGAPTIASASISDTTPPELKSFSFSPARIDTSATSASITFTLRLVDDLAGVTGASITVRSPSGEHTASGSIQPDNRISGDAHDGVYVSDAKFRALGEAGTWTIETISVYDAADNARRWKTAQLEAAGWPTRVEVSSSPDASPPDLKAFSFSPARIDTSAMSASITFTLRLVDDLAGVTGASITVRSPSGEHTASGSIQPDNRISGDAHDGVYVSDAKFRALGEAGTWTIETISVYDAADNARRWKTAQLEAAGWPTRVEVSSSPDASPPDLKAFSFSPARIDTSTTSASITLTLRLTDDVAGVTGASITVRSPSGEHTASGSIQPDNRISGDAHDGVYVSDAKFRALGEAGTWTIETISVYDAADNARRWTRAQLEAAGWPTRIEVGTPPESSGSTRSP